MGVSHNEFWTLNPRKLNVIVDGYKLRRKVIDEEQWMLGGYVNQAVEIALANAFRKKNEKAKQYFNVLDKPALRDIDKEGISEEEKKKKLDMLMASLHVMQSNFNLTHGK